MSISSSLGAEPDPEHSDESPLRPRLPSETTRLELDALWAMLGRSSGSDPAQMKPDEPDPEDD